MRIIIIFVKIPKLKLNNKGKGTRIDNWNLGYIRIKDDDDSERMKRVCFGELMW